MERFKSNGKLLLTGEYVVLDGALALAIPTKYGQSLEIKRIKNLNINWTSLDNQNNIWFETSLPIKNINKDALNIIKPSNPTQRLLQILTAAKLLNPQFLEEQTGLEVTTVLDFPQNWGLGTSSTLINNIALWANVNPYKLLELTFGGSGYDIACAQHNTPITYQLKNKSQEATPVNFNPPFKDKLYFVYLNKKQNSRDGIANYKALKPLDTEVINNINAITLQTITNTDFDTFNQLIEQHEHIIAQVTKQDTVKQLLFPDFNGAIKSLGAWGGDFILVSSKINPKIYFNNKGYNTVIPYSEMTL